MARLNGKRRRELAALKALRSDRPAFELVSAEGALKSSQASFTGSKHRAPHGTYKVAAVRPTIKTGKRKSGEVSSVTRDETIIIPNPDKIVHRDQLPRPSPRPEKRQGNRILLKAKKPFSLDGL